MSNTKWRAVFSALKDKKLGIRQIIVKFIDVDKPEAIGLPWLKTSYPFVDSARFGPFPLISIEWIEVPTIALFARHSNVPAEEYPQDTIAIRSALVALGKRLPLEDMVTGLRVVGLVR